MKTRINPNFTSYLAWLNRKINKFIAEGQSKERATYNSNRELRDVIGTENYSKFAKWVRDI